MLPEKKLPEFVRFHDLVAAGVVRNWPTLLRLIREENFPAGVMIGRNTRAWDVDAVRAWLAMRPTERKPMPGRRTADADPETQNPAAL